MKPATPSGDGPAKPTVVRAKPGPRLSAAAPPQGPSAEGALKLLQLEADIRRAASLRELQFHLANESRSALEFRQGVVFVRKRGRMRVCAISSVSTIERNAPMVRWMEAVIRDHEGAQGLAEVAALNLEGKAGVLGRDSDVYAFPHLLWLPIKTRKGKVVGGLIAARERAWPERRKVIASRLSETYSHAWSSLTRDRAGEGFRLAPRLVGAVVLCALIAAGFIPTPITAIAPVSVVGKDTVLVTSPIDGVMKDILVRPNDPVSAGQVLALVEDTEIRNAAEIAERAVLVAEARLEALSSSAFARRSWVCVFQLSPTQYRLPDFRISRASRSVGSNPMLTPAASPTSWAPTRKSASDRLMTGPRIAARIASSPTDASRTRMI